MGDLFERIAAHKPLAISLAVASVLMFVGSLLAVPWIIARAPRDFFTREAPPASGSIVRKVFKNLFGLVLAGAGVAMLFLPGQGVLALIVGIALLDIPGKHALLVKAAKRPSVMRALNYVRKRSKREPFDEPS
jgi:hypothetical protein